MCVFVNRMYSLLKTVLAPHSLRYAFGYEANDTSANTFFWFMHSVTLTLHGMVIEL